MEFEQANIIINKILLDNNLIVLVNQLVILEIINILRKNLLLNYR